jgi:hypothetical protein
VTITALYDLYFRFLAVDLSFPYTCYHLGIDGSANKQDHACKKCLNRELIFFHMKGQELVLNGWTIKIVLESLDNIKNINLSIWDSKE